MRNKAKEYIPKKVTFIVTKHENQMLTDIHHGFLAPVIFTNLKTLAIHFLHDKENHGINRTTMLGLIKKHLIKYDAKQLKYILTNLGKRMIRLGKQTPNKTIVTTVEKKSRDIHITLKSYTR